jgi:hypothetical protein
MKNVFFSLAFMLIGSFASANNVETSTSDVLSNQPLKNITINFEDLNNLNFESLKDCKITIRKKNADGTWTEYQIVVHDNDCGKLVATVITNL